jgi:hypothetical protein
MCHRQGGESESFAKRAIESLVKKLKVVTTTYLVPFSHIFLYLILIYGIYIISGKT